MVCSFSSTSSSLFSNKTLRKKYDVFLSFRGVDTRNNFTSHLYSAFSQKNIETFIDDKLVRGDEISPSLLNAIKESEIAVVIFSEGYGSSRWCLKELVKILKCKERYGQIVIPIFYHIDPSDVRNQTGNFGVAFSKLKERFKDRVEKLQRWRIALREASNLSGFDSHVIRSESVLVQKIVDDILKRLNDILPVELDKDLVGVESHIKDIESLLSYGSKCVYTLGICGIGGIGKTTIARVIFNKFSNHFDGSCFLQNVRELCEKESGLSQLQCELLSTLLRDGSLNIGIHNINSHFRRLSRKKVLITFDDVTHTDQVESLVHRLDWFMTGSLIIITTRDKQILQNCGVESIYEMKELENVDALKLFSWYAFKQDQPNVGYKELSDMVLQYAQGVPLALKVLGRFLFGRSKGEWNSEIEKLKRIPHKDIQKVLKISYDGLDDKIQNIFLDIACFLKGVERDFAIQFFNACGFYAEIGISVLVDRCLIIISDNKITMHDLLQKMGREIVRQESIDDPGKRSRLCHVEEILEVLRYNMGTKSIQGISLDMSKIQELSFNFNNLENMPNLRFLKFHGENKCHISDFEDKAYNFPKLRYLHWRGYPLKSLPIQAENLISLVLSNSKIEQLWDGIQNVVNLKEICLDYSERLTRLPDLSKAQNLEKLVLNGCSSLVETHSSIQYLNKLVTLSLFSCKSLRSLPRSIRSKSLEYLYLSGCSNLETFPELSSNNLYRLELSETAIEEIPSCIGCQSRLVRLNLANCPKLKSLPISLCKMKSLEYLHLPICSNLQRLLDELGDLEALQRLNVEGTAIGRPPFFSMTFTWLSHSTSIFFQTAKGHEQMAGFILSVSFLHRLQSLKYLYLTGCGIMELPECLGQLFSLEELHLANNYFERIPESIINLSKLKSLHLCYCEWLESLPNLPCNLQYMDAAHCTSLQVLSCLSIFKLTRLYNYIVESFHLSNCHKLDVEKSDGANFIFPGSEIPEWFKNQSMGSSISVKLPPVDWDEFKITLVGFAFGIIIALDKRHHRQNQIFSLHYKITVKTENGDWHFAFGDYLHTLRASVPVDSEHVHLGYQLSSSLLPFSSCKLGFIDELSVEFYLIKCHDAPLCVECWSPSRSEDCCVPGRYVECYFPGRCVACCKAVRKCGIHLLYAQNLEESKEDRSTDEEEEH